MFGKRRLDDDIQELSENEDFVDLPDEGQSTNETQNQSMKLN